MRDSNYTLTFASEEIAEGGAEGHMVGLIAQVCLQHSYFSNFHFFGATNSQSTCICIPTNHPLPISCSLVCVELSCRHFYVKKKQNIYLV